MGILLFNKREILKGRTQKLERAFIALATTIESESAQPQAALYPAKDISECTAQSLDNPERSDFWDKYKTNLEIQDVPKMDLTPKKIQLMQYFRVDPATGVPLRNPEDGTRLTDGEGTMQQVLNDVIKKSNEQLARLNETRQQLTEIREELVRTVSELNDRKSTLRQRLREIVDLRDQISRLDSRIRDLENDVENLKQEKRELETQITDLRGTIDRLEKEKAQLDEKNKQLTKENDDLRKGVKGQQAAGGIIGGDPTLPIARIERGDKGSVVSVNDTWNFLVLKLSDRFVEELRGVTVEGPISPVELYVRRPGAEGADEKFVTKIRLIHVSQAQKLGVADILIDWKQVPVQTGDVVFF